MEMYQIVEQTAADKPDENQVNAIQIQFRKKFKDLKNTLKEKFKEMRNILIV